MIFIPLKGWYVQSIYCTVQPKSPCNARAQETLSADTVEEFLRSKEMSVLVEDGGICLALVYGMPEALNACSTGAILHEDEAPVPDEAKAIFYAQAESGV